VVSFCTEELVKLGHQVTLFASGDSVTEAELVAVSPSALRLSKTCVDPHIYHALLLEQVYKRAESFDIIHFHCDYMHFPLSRRMKANHITTLHGRLDIPDLAPLYREFAEMPLVSISYAQRKPLHWANWVANVYHGIPKALFTPQYKPGSYLVFVGRISPEKRVDRAINIALKSGIPIKIAAKVDRADQEYFAQEIKPLLCNSCVEFLGEVSDAEKNTLLGNALALLFPIELPEPFGLAMIESMACGTPVIAFRHGSVPEVIDEGKTGFVVTSEGEALAALEKAARLDRRLCRRIFEERFSAERMAADYIKVYSQLCQPGSASKVSSREGSAWTKSSK